MGRKKQLSEGNLFGLRLAIAFLASVIPIVAFGGLARYVWQGNVQPAEVRILEALQSISTPLLTHFFHSITILGNTETVLIILPLLGLLLIRLNMTRGFTHLVLVCAAGGGALTMLLKDFFERARPALGLLDAPGYSFPSGHSIISLCLFGSLAYLLVNASISSRQKRVGFVVCLLLVLGIGFSRMYLGVHYPTDVIAGYTAGGIWLTGCILAYRRFIEQSISNGKL